MPFSLNEKLNLSFDPQILQMYILVDTPIQILLRVHLFLNRITAVNTNFQLDYHHLYVHNARFHVVQSRVLVQDVVI